MQALNSGSRKSDDSEQTRKYVLFPVHSNGEASKMIYRTKLFQNTKLDKHPSLNPAFSNGVLLSGYLRKLKSMRKKYFVLLADGMSQPAQLNYYDSLKSWKNGQLPKRSIVVRSCFNINRKIDSKHKFVISIYTNEDCILIAYENEDDLSKWLMVLLEIHLGNRCIEGVPLKPVFEHLWVVKIRNEDVGRENNLAGTHRLCLNVRTFTLVLFRMPLTEPPEMWEFPIMSIRQCGLFGRCFFLEMGRAAPTGPGRLWMKVKNASVAHHLHWTIIWAMRDSAVNHLSSSLRAHCSSVSESGQSSTQT